MTLAITKPGLGFSAAVDRLTEPGERDAVEKYLRRPMNLNVTRDGDVQSNVSRLPSVVREALEIGGLAVAEFDIQSAHAALLGMFYAGESGNDWTAEKARFSKEVERGFPTIYGEGKAWKIPFLSALNQRTHVAWHTSHGYREFAQLFPLLGRKLAGIKSADWKAAGRRLRSALAKIMECLIIQNADDGIHTIPVVDSAVVALPATFAERHKAEFRTAWRLAVPIGDLTDTSPCIKGSKGEKYRFCL